jgi:hypothetical protein
MGKMLTACIAKKSWCFEEPTPRNIGEPLAAIAELIRPAKFRSSTTACGIPINPVATAKHKEREHKEGKQ